MSVEELKAGLARLADPVVPAEDPYGRLLRRARRSRRARLAGWTSGLAAALVAAVLAPLLLQASGSPSPAPSPGVDDLRGADISVWVRRLLDTPARGDLAGDTRFTSTLTDRITPGMFGFSPELDRRTVLFAGDVGTYRAVLIGFHSDSRQLGVWLVGDAGQSAAQFVAAAASNIADMTATGPTRELPTKVLVEELRPFTATAVGDAATNRQMAVGLAPEGCRVATKDITHPQTWHDEASVDYVVRTDPLAGQMSTFARVTCDGVVRHQAPLSSGRVDVRPVPVTDAQVDAALTGARGTPADRTLVRRALVQLPADQSVPPDACKVLYSGAVPGSVDSSAVPGGAVREPPVLVMTCVTAHGNTLFQVFSADGAGSGGYSRVKITDPHAVLVVRGVLERESTATTPAGEDAHVSSSTVDERCLVLAPAGATLLQLLRGGQVSQSLPLQAGVGSITVPIGETVQLRALDGSGSVVGSGVGPIGENISEEHPAPTDTTIDNWS